MKILMVHGSRQSGELFNAKVQALEKLIQRSFGQCCEPGGVKFVYPTAPFALEHQYGEWAWWRSESTEGPYPGLDKGLDSIASVLQTSGPFDGMIGFSQGATLATMVASLLEKDRRDSFDRLELGNGIAFPAGFAALDHAPLRFVVSISGYASSHPSYRAFYDPHIRTPTLHFLGSLDSVVDEGASLELVERCRGPGAGQEPGVVRHSGGHVVPSGKRELASVIAFIGANMD